METMSRKIGEKELDEEKIGALMNYLDNRWEEIEKELVED